MAVSVVAPVSDAIDATRRILFEPFDLKKWFVLGFSAWLAKLMEGGSYGNWNLPGEDDGLDGAGLGEFVQQNLSWIIPVAIGAFVLFAALGLALTWLTSRGKFMFLDGVLNNRAAIAAPWERFRGLGWSLFLLRLVVGLVFFGIFAALVGGVALVAWPSASSGSGFDFASSPSLLIPVFFVIFIFVLGAVIFSVVLDDFLVPVMYLREQTVPAAWPEVRSLILGNPGTFVLYGLFKMLLSIGIFVIVIIVVVCSCCIAALPYLGTVILLPIHVFLRAYSLCFLGQFGTAYERFTRVGSEVDELVQTFE